jgi:FkbM family methyltransferase
MQGKPISLRRMPLFRRLTYSRGPVKLARRLGLNHFLSRAYCRVFGRRGILRLRLGDQTASFAVSDPAALRLLEAPMFQSFGESIVITTVLGKINPGDVVYDIGASLGTHTVYWAQKVGPAGRVVAFEPEPRSYEWLKRNIALNELGNVLAYNIALGKEKGQGALHGYGAMYGTFNLHGAGRRASSDVIEIVRGDDFIQQENIPRPAVAKIDVEGFEFDVLQGLQANLSQKACRFLCLELHPHLWPKEVKVQDLERLVRSCGFRIEEFSSREETSHWFCAK